MIRLKPSYTLLFLASAGFSLGVWFLVIPELVQLQTVRSQVAAASAGTLPLPKPDASTKNLESMRQEVLLLMPTSDQQYDVSVQIEALAKSSSVLLTSLSVTGASGAAGGTTATTVPGAAAPIPSTTQQLVVSLGVSGSYSQVEQFITTLPTLERYVTITQLTMSGVRSSATLTNSGEVSASVTATAYYLPLPANFPK